MSQKKRAIIIGAGPAGLTAAYELIKRSDIEVTLIEADPEYVGGIARTVNYKGNRIDIGGHRFFSKSDRVMNWWMNILPVQAEAGEELEITYHGKHKTIENSGEIEDPDKVLLVRNRKSRIYFSQQFFDYPVKLNADTIRKLGLVKIIRIGLSYMRYSLFPIRNESNLEEFFINRFGKELYHTFFKSYTEKVWGRECKDISAEWGKQRIKGLNLRSALAHFFKSLFQSDKSIDQKNKETSLIERFLYPKLGPGQLWEVVRDQVMAQGAKLHMGYSVNKINANAKGIQSVEAISTNGEIKVFEGDYFFSTMPIKDLFRAWSSPIQENLTRIAEGLEYRDFFTVGLLLKDLRIKEGHKQAPSLIKDNWIYIQEPGVEIGRLQIFNNWSPYMVADATTVWLGLEYFCKETDPIWSESEENLIQLGKDELERIGIIYQSECLDACVLKMPKTYPAYFGTYSEFDKIQAFLNEYGNLFPVGRNGMHKYNNQDHSMLTAMGAVDNILEGRTDKSNLWEINTEEEYHEEK